MKLGHISDLHILAFDPWKNPARFLNKRLVGGVNLLLKRSKSHSPALVQRALERLAEQDVDHIAVTGDLSNLALEEEFAAAARILTEIPISDDRLSVVPGNHDYYTPQAQRGRPFEAVFGRYQRSDLPTYQLDSGYPFCKLLEDEVALIGLNSGMASLPLMATGRVDARELRSLEQLLEDPKVRDRFKVVMIHHPLLPFEHSRVEYTRRLINAREVLTLLRQKNVELAIHGHNHYYHNVLIPWLGKPGMLRICETGSTSQGQKHDEHYSGKFNIYTILAGRLEKIETHIFETEAGGFVPWREEVFVQEEVLT